MSFHDMKLGKLAAVHDPRVPMLATYRTPALPSPPSAIDWSKGNTQYGMMLNDKEGDCTCAAIGHAIQTWTINSSGKMLTVPDDMIQTAYSAISGYDPKTGSNDNGAVILDVLKYWQAKPIDSQPLNGFVAVNPGDVNAVKDAIWLFGGIYIGVLLPMSAQTQSIWSQLPGPLTGDNEPGSWGGHAIYVVAYDERYLTCITWGVLMKMTWQWFHTYCDEAYALLSTSWVNNVAKSQAPSGFDYATLLADQKVLQSHYAKCAKPNDPWFVPGKSENAPQDKKWYEPAASVLRGLLPNNEDPSGEKVNGSISSDAQGTAPNDSEGGAKTEGDAETSEDDQNKP